MRFNINNITEYSNTNQKQTQLMMTMMMMMIIIISNDRDIERGGFLKEEGGYVHNI